MSLTSLIDQPAISELFKSFVPPSPRELPKPLLAPPLTEHYSLVGAAFDYLLRFFIQRLNPHANASSWVAEKALFFIESVRMDGKTFEPLAERVPSKRVQQAKKHLENARTDYSAYLQSGIISDDLLAGTLRLAHLEVAYRAGPDKMNWEGLDDISHRDVGDLRALIALAQTVDFRATKACFLNPSFHFASNLVHGADADIILDDKIIDIKTRKDFSLRSSDRYQLVGYYLLLLLDGIGLGSKDKPIMYAEEISDISVLAIYYSRHGYLRCFPISEMIDRATFPSFAMRFVELACPRESERHGYWRKFRGRFAVGLRESVIPSAKTKRLKTSKKIARKPVKKSLSTRTRKKATK